MAELAGALDANELVSVDVALVGATYAVAFNAPLLRACRSPVRC